ncbi:MAG: hypothetical protein Q7T80_13810 [Methanoregula sp.]|nr:hypothetical protein [Methanoregula sp.]
MSVRQGVKGPLERWDRAARALRKEDQPYGESVAALARLHSSEAFYGCDEPLEAAVFSGLIGILKREGERGEQEEREEQKRPACTVDLNKKPDPNKRPENEECNVDP